MKMGLYKKRQKSKEIEGRGVYINTKGQFPREAKEGREKVKEIIATLSENKLNFILPLMNSQGEVYYNSKLSRCYTQEWDPLKEIVKEAIKMVWKFIPGSMFLNKGAKKKVCFLFNWR